MFSSTYTSTRSYKIKRYAYRKNSKNSEIMDSDPCYKHSHTRTDTHTHIHSPNIPTCFCYLVRLIFLLLCIAVALFHSHNMARAIDSVEKWLEIFVFFVHEIDFSRQINENIIQLDPVKRFRVSVNGRNNFRMRVTSGIIVKNYLAICEEKPIRGGIYMIGRSKRIVACFAFSTDALIMELLILARRESEIASSLWSFQLFLNDIAKTTWQGSANSSSWKKKPQRINVRTAKPNIFGESVVMSIFLNVGHTLTAYFTCIRINFETTTKNAQTQQSHCTQIKYIHKNR